MSRRTTAHTSIEQSLPTEVLEVVEPEATDTPSRRRRSGRRRPPAGFRRPALFLAVAAAGGIMVNVLAAGDPGAVADQPTSVAAQLGLGSQDTGISPSGGAISDRLEELAAQRSQREAEQAAAAQSQAAADQAALEAKAAAEYQASLDYQASLEAQAAQYQASLDYQAALEEQAAQYQASLKAQAAAEAKAAKEAAAAAEAASSSRQAPAAAAPSAGSGSSGSFQDYALAQLGGDAGQFSCLESLWGKESGWNPNAQNPTSTAYGIPQFLNSTWAGTGIAKTSDGYRQIDAGLIYIDSRYGSPCGAWSHSKSTGWY